MSASNVDAAEIAKFEALAERWWDSEGEFRPLHLLNPLRLDYVDEHAPLAGTRVVDIGCGGGLLSEAMARRGAKVTGVDMAGASLAVARLHADESGVDVDYRESTAEALADAEPGEYDTVTCMELLEHVPDPATVVDACARLVKPGGRVFFSTINRSPKSYLLAIVGAEYVLRLLPRGTHDYAKFIKPSELDACGRASGLELEQVIGMTYNPLTGTFRLGPDVGVNYLMRFRAAGGSG